MIAQLHHAESELKLEEEEILKKYGLADGDVLVRLTATRRERDYGYVAVVRSPHQLLLNQRIARLRVQGGMEPAFLALALQSEPYRNRFFGYETGNVGQGNVGMAAVSTETVPLAPLLFKPFCAIKLAFTFVVIHTSLA